LSNTINRDKRRRRNKQQQKKSEKHAGKKKRNESGEYKRLFQCCDKEYICKREKEKHCPNVYAIENKEETKKIKFFINS